MTFVPSVLDWDSLPWSKNVKAWKVFSVYLYLIKLREKLNKNTLYVM